LRALPTIGLLIFFVVLISPHIHWKSEAPYLIPTEIVLIVLAVPSILSNTFAGVQNVDPAARDAARGMGMTGRQVLFKVELPCALPLIMSGVRSATLQVVATTTIAAYVSLGGLGRYVFDGQSQQDYPQMASGAVLVALLAMAADFVLALLQRAIVSRGVSGRYAKGAGDIGPVDALAGGIVEAEVARV
jgi:osmoprotectant transport system permease protein